MNGSCSVSFRTLGDNKHTQLHAGLDLYMSLYAIHLGQIISTVLW